MRFSWVSMVLFGTAASLSGAAPTVDFTVRTPGNQFAFRINGVDGPALELVRGRTYVFEVQTSVGYHPFHIYSPGTSTNDIDSGLLRYTVPMDEENYFYDCSGHFGAMRGEIVTIPPPPPPTFQILSLNVGSNVVVTSTGTNTWSVTPEFATNLPATTWTPLIVQTNRFRNGTNEIICGRPVGSKVFLRLKAQELVP